MTTRTLPGLAIHPGEYIAEELEARAISQRELARRTGQSVRTISMVLSGRKPLTVEFALALEREWGVSAETWLNLQLSYDRSLARAS